jgi:hypothetical protein
MDDAFASVVVSGHETPSRCELVPWRHTVKCEALSPDA